MSKHKRGFDMSSGPGFEGKIDVLDMLINILKDHEESLSGIVGKLDFFIDNLSSAQKKIKKMDRILQQENLSNIVDRLDIFVDNLSSVLEKISREFAFEDGRRVAVVDCRKWLEFRTVSMGASFVAFETDVWNVFSVTSACRDFIFRYSERLPVSQNDVVPEGSVCHKVLNMDPRSLRRWLSDELKVPEDKIIQGDLSKSLGGSN